MKKIGMKKMVGARKRGAPMPKMMAAPKAMKPMAMEGQTPPMAGPMPQGIPGMKKGGAVKKGFSTKSGRGGVAERGLGKATKGFAKGGMAKPLKGGLGIMIILGKKKGK